MDSENARALFYTAQKQILSEDLDVKSKLRDAEKNKQQNVSDLGSESGSSPGHENPSHRGRQLRMPCDARGPKQEDVCDAPPTEGAAGDGPPNNGDVSGTPAPVCSFSFSFPLTHPQTFVPSMRPPCPRPSAGTGPTGQWSCGTCVAQGSPGVLDTLSGEAPVSAIQRSSHPGPVHGCLLVPLGGDCTAA